jgi:hypothetical protein
VETYDHKYTCRLKDGVELMKCKKADGRFIVYLRRNEVDNTVI